MGVWDNIRLKLFRWSLVQNMQVIDIVTCNLENSTCYLLSFNGTVFCDQALFNISVLLGVTFLSYRLSLQAYSRNAREY